ncbi:hypothetical protein OROGR_017017 [Orobanche gracilis]
MIIDFIKGVVGGSATGRKDLPYNIGETYPSAWGSWVHSRGTSKDDGAPVSVFSLSGSNFSDGHLVAGRNGVKRLRMSLIMEAEEENLSMDVNENIHPGELDIIHVRRFANYITKFLQEVEGQGFLCKNPKKYVRHPNILSFLHSTETETSDGSTTKVTIYVVTEPVMPLSEKLKDLGLEGIQRDDYFAWGLHRIAKAVSFLNNDCKLVHGNVCMDSVVVTQTLDWKLHAFDVLSEFEENYEASTGPMLQYEYLIGTQYKPMELLKSDWTAVRRSPPWAIDSWGLDLSKRKELGNTASIPKALLPDYQALLSSVPSRRLNSSKLLENSEYFHNKLVETIQFMENLNLKDSVEKDTFFRKLANLAEQLPREIVLKKLLPLLVSHLEFGSAVAAALTVMLKLGSWLPPEEFSLKVLPTIVKLFASNDRAIFVGLLQHIDQFGDSLTTEIVEEHVRSIFIYPHVANCLSDTSAFLRELSLRSMFVLAPKLSQRTVSGPLIKFLSKLHVDEEPAIRTNTIMLLGNIASYLNDGTRKRVLINAFAVRALRDNSSPVRGAGIVALCATSPYYDVTEIATRILPNLVMLTIDPDSDVQLKAFQAVEYFLQLVKQYHEKTGDREASDSRGTGMSLIPGGASFIGRAVNSLTLKGKPLQQNTHASPAPLTSTATCNYSSGMDGADATPIHVNATANLSNSTDDPPRVFPASTDGLGEAENGIHKEQDSERDGWDDIEPLREKPLPVPANIEAIPKQPVSKPKPQVPISRLKSTFGTSKDDDGDLWDSVPDSVQKTISKRTTAKASWVVGEDDPQVAVATPPNKSLDLKLSADDDLWASIAAPPPTTGSKTASVVRGRGTKHAAPKLGASRINRISSGVN